MTAEQWERVKRLFESAVRLRGPDREAYVNAACGDNAELRQTLNDLLANHDDVAGFLEEADTTATTRPVFSPGQLVANRFRVIRLISRGGMGEVYEALDEKLRLRLALKTLRADLASDPEARQRFQREICVAREVSHQSICRVFDLVEHHREKGESGGVIICLTMQLLEGENLGEYLSRNRPLSPGEALEIAAQIAVALDLLHQHGIVHRDLKPSNIMLVKQGDESFRVVVMDFGLAKLSDEDRGWFETKADLQAGAPFFLAPEELRGERPSFASDIYAFGLILDEMVTSSRAFTSDSIHGLFYQKLWEEPSPPSRRSQGLPSVWEKQILSCLRQDPLQRPADACDIVAQLRKESVVPVLANRRSGSLQRFRTALTRMRSVPLASRRVRRTAAVLLVSAALLGVGTIARSAGRPAQIAVAVYDIANTNDAAGYSYLCKGMTAELIRELAMRNSLRVIPMREAKSATSRHSPDAPFSLEGELQGDGNHIRVDFRVTDRSGTVVWADKFDRDNRNTLDVQTLVAEQAVNAVELKALNVGKPGILLAKYNHLVSPFWQYLGLQVKAAGPTTSNSRAWNLYLRGRYRWDDRTLAGTRTAITYYRQALNEDPRFGLAYAALADAHITLMEFKEAPPLELLAQAHRFAQKSVEVSPENAEGYVSLAAIQQQNWDWTASAASSKRAMELNPGLARAHRWYGGMIIQFGQFEEGLRETELALRLDPYDFPAHSAYGLYLHYSGRYEKAAHHLEDTIRGKQDLMYAHIILGNVYAKLGTLRQGEEAAAYFRKAIEQAGIVAKLEREDRQSQHLDTDIMPMSDPLFALYYAVAGDTGRSQEYLNQILTKQTGYRSSKVDLAEIYTAMGQTQKALDLLEAAAEVKEKALVYLKVHPFLENLHSDGRFIALQRRMQL